MSQLDCCNQCFDKPGVYAAFTKRLRHISSSQLCSIQSTFLCCFTFAFTSLASAEQCLKGRNQIPVYLPSEDNAAMAFIVSLTDCHSVYNWFVNSCEFLLSCPDSVCLPPGVTLAFCWLLTHVLMQPMQSRKLHLEIPDSEPNFSHCWRVGY